MPLKSNHKLDCLVRMEILTEHEALGNEVALGIAIQNAACYKCRLESDRRCEPFELLQYFNKHKLQREAFDIRELGQVGMYLNFRVNEE